ncbi:MAG TPA: hypothetical protein VM165_20335 [Planctomycetaceae bacterium]|nr:hypothetical protein [Planctomycetaceae bacterium]
MTETKNRPVEELLALSSAEMLQVQGGTDDVTTSADGDGEEIASHGYIRIKKLNTGG